MTALIQVQDLALGLAELNAVHMGPLLKPVKVPLDGIPSLKQTNCITLLGVTCKLAEGALNPTIYGLNNVFNSTGPSTVNKIFNSTGPSTDPGCSLRNTATTHYHNGAQGQ